MDNNTPSGDVAGIGRVNRRRLTRRAFLGGISLAAVGILQACTQPTAQPTGTAAAPGAASPTVLAETPAAVGTPAAAGTPMAAGTPSAGPALPGNLGGTVSVLATWGGDEQEAFLEMIRPFEEQTGTTVEYEGTRDLNAVLLTRVQGNNPPDVAGLPGPGPMAEFARQGALIDLAEVLDMQTFERNYSQAWRELAQVDGMQVGVFIKAALKGLIWYNPNQFQQLGYSPPQTWDELLELSRTILQDTGTAPWSIGLESAATSGWPGTDWIEDIVMRQSGPDVYNRWHRGEIRWTSPEIRQAWETWGEIVADPQMVFGGAQNMLATNFGDAANPLFTDPPNAYLHHQASFITGFIQSANPDLQPVTDFNFFPFPSIDQQFGGVGEIAGDLVGMFRDTPQSRALMQWIASPEAQAIWVRRGGALSASENVPLSEYPDDLSRQLAQSMLEVETPLFDGSDLMPEQMNNAFFTAVLDYVSNPGDLDSILSNLDQIQAAAYG